MIPRVKPYLGWEEFRAAFALGRKAVKEFEKKFAQAFEVKYTLVFPYGRSGLYALLKSQGIKGAEVIIPAYTCAVVPSAVVASGNIPRFVDISLEDYNMDLDLLENSITEKVKVVIPTNLFGYPVNTERLFEILNQIGRKILVIQDCAQSFGASYKGKLVSNEGDAAIYGLGIGKVITSIFGGIVTTNNPQIYEPLREFRDSHFSPSDWLKSIRRFTYLFSAFLALNDSFYRITNFLEEKTPFLHYFTSEDDETRINMPKDFLDCMIDIEARVGIEQLKKYPEIVKRRREIALYYDQNFQPIKNKVKLPPIIDGATYSHYVVQVDDRIKIIEDMKRRGIQLGWSINYSIPELPAYRKYRTGSYPKSLLCSRTNTKLPNYPGLTHNQCQMIVKEFIEATKFA